MVALLCGKARMKRGRADLRMLKTPDTWLEPMLVIMKSSMEARTRKKSNLFHMLWQ